MLTLFKSFNYVESQDNKVHSLLRNFHIGMNTKESFNTQKGVQSVVL